MASFALETCLLSGCFIFLRKAVFELMLPITPRSALAVSEVSNPLMLLSFVALPLSLFTPFSPCCHKISSALTISSRSFARHSAALGSESPFRLTLLSMSGTVTRGLIMFNVFSSFLSTLTQSTSDNPSIFPSHLANGSSMPTKYGDLADRNRSMCGGTTGMSTCFHISNPCANAEDAALTHMDRRVMLLEMRMMRRSHKRALMSRTKLLGPMYRIRGMIGDAISSGTDSGGRHSKPGWSVKGR
mmetsp:Transcript_5047/g.12659  ORF Transcript_5047/g.12659 Transcript_5047/m.12659 type:complete len:244 (-) Transcript_5047:522-1253(-)